MEFKDPICSQILSLSTLKLDSDLEIAGDETHHLAVVAAPIVSSYNDRIRPVLDAVDKLRNLAVMDEGIELPTIVVVGDQSSGKSSVLESLARINLPRGQGICTRVPLVMRLQNHSSPEPEIFLEYSGKVVPTTEDNISEAINMATGEIAGNGKGISKTRLTLTVKKQGVPDLTMVDLPGITRVPVLGQPENIYDQIRDIIMEYIKPEASIILNVLSATVDFPTCESIRMSQSVDKNGERTLAVVTKCDKSPEGLLEKVTSDDVNIGLGYVCVRNRIGDESYEEARTEESALFASHPLLSKIDKSIVGVPVLAQNLMQIQAKSIARNLPDIVKKINDKLNHNLTEFKKLPKTMSSVAEAMTAFMRILGQVKESLQKILIRGEFDEYPDDKKMHCTARLVEMLNNFNDELKNSPQSDRVGNFLMEEIKHLEEAKEISLPNFLPRTAFLAILQEKVNGISNIPTEFVGRVWNYIEEVVISVLMSHVEDYYQLQLSTRRAGLNLIEKMKEQSMKWVMEVVEMEKLTDYTCNPEFLSEWNRLMAEKEAFMKDIDDNSRYQTNLDGFGWIATGNLRPFRHLLDQAFDLRMRMISYWRIVLRRLVDCMALHLQLSVNNLVNKDLEFEIVSELMAPHGNGIERLMEESPSVSTKRVKLTGSVKKLKECKEILATIMDRIGSK
ncbi:Dynamin-related protein 4C [Morus notabilis]|uniref:Dynamin-related protein 4C n=1 Tax=Morus notabilis TaxID=981085 RepID=W9QQY9_9ROSA|nr:dynamin-related protein 4C [Morus notabilis]XP_010088629.1 dynamin-related protein 4C [Morus notabilis]EXB36789.1 Dynamin-related protein 4C [Morus notabilis]EXB36791.1 Dynamin-related protein 4C [Morus notabilis]